MSQETSASLAVEESLTRCWATLGLPLGAPRLEERKEGLVDPEALTVLSLLFCQDSRLLADVAVWLSVNNDLLLHQKIGHLARRLDESRRAMLLQRVAARDLSAVPSPVARALGATDRPRGAVPPRLVAREGKLAPRQVMAARAGMVRNRLLFGASLRADLVSALQCRHRSGSGRQLAATVGASPSTVSRVLADLEAGGFKLADGTLDLHLGTFPGFFVSARTVENVPRIIDASKVHDADLRRAALPQLQRETDALGAQVARLVR